MKKVYKHLLFASAALVCVHLPLLAMYVVKAGPAAYILFYYPPVTLIPFTALVLGICAGAHLKRYWYVPLLAPMSYWLSFYGAFQPYRWMGAYLLLGAAGMLACHFARLLLRRRREGLTHENDI